MKKLIGIKYLTALLIGGLASGSAYGQFTLSAEVRPRTEFRNGFKTPTSDGFEPAVFTEQRSRLYVDYKQDKYQLKLAFQDVRFWGQTGQIFKSEPGATFLSEAWGQLQLSPKVGIKAGRQIISYDNQRFLGGLEWAQQGRRHDALLFKINDAASKLKLDIGFAFNSDQDIAEPGFLQRPAANFYSVGGNYKTMQYAWLHKDFEAGAFSLLALNDGRQNADSTMSFKQTFGFIGSKNVGKVKLAADVYYQTGELSKRKVNALLAGVNATFKTKATPITIGYEYISGKDDSDASSTITNFSPDFGTNHAHNGFMDYFFVGPANGNVGVQDIYLKTKFKLGKGALLAHAHEFLTGSEQLTESGGVIEKAMGTEIDLVYVQKIGKDVTLNLGFSQLFGTETLTTLRPGNSKSNNWAWAMITFKPTLFSSDK
ncbi:alginate export family protein [Jiulongibacter sp. NS-SX5]|uniref:alginate export family protein n=1 Tax=Jiulongibacter sp. NS-SX5 TaxID=3463854 RepID=UPI0040593ED2